MKSRVDKQGRIVILKKGMERYNLPAGSELDMACLEDKIELIPTSEETDLAMIELNHPCRTGHAEAHRLRRLDLRYE